MSTEITGPSSDLELVAKEGRINREMRDYYEGEYAEHGGARSALEALYDDAFKAGKVAALDQVKVKIND